MTRRHDQMAPRDRDYNDTALLERSGASRRGRLSALHNDPEKLHWLFECNRTPSAATRRRFARVSRPTCWPRMMAAAAQRLLDRVFGVVIMASWQNNSAHPHRPWRASSPGPVADRGLSTAATRCRSQKSQIGVVARPQPLEGQSGFLRSCVCVAVSAPASLVRTA